MTYLDSITLTRALACLAYPGRIIVIGKPGHSLGEVIPYLATLPSVIAYNPKQLSLTFRRAQGFMTIQSEEVYITQVKDTEEGLELLEALVASINAVWEHRAELVAVTTYKRTPRPLDVWSLLPQSNCKRCGEATCMAFAVGLLQQTRELNECLPLQEDAGYSDRRITLESMLE
jgi:ArsR family metal-binding transcriptional regulator